PPSISYSLLATMLSRGWFSLAFLLNGLQRLSQLTRNQTSRHNMSLFRRRTSTLPIPPLNFREIVGPTDEAAFDNPERTRIWGDLAIGPLAPGEAYERVFDFGCGCGRNARQLFLQEQPPAKYVGIDIHK